MGLTSPVSRLGDHRRYNVAVEYFRSMMADLDGAPIVGRSSRGLGVRVPEDIAPDETGAVTPGTGGMSVAPTVRGLPNHRRPRPMGLGSTGPASDRVYEIEEPALLEGTLAVRPDPRAPDVHAFVEPAHRAPLASYEGNLVFTRPAWRQVWP